jgi:putative addiction module killer protein
VKIKIYETAQGKKPFHIWLSSLRDKAIIGRVRARVSRIESGNFGDSKSVGKGVLEMRFAFGSGHRIYYGMDGDCLVVLLLGGDKSSQKKDIKLAHLFWNDYLVRGIYEKYK